MAPRIGFYIAFVFSITLSSSYARGVLSPKKSATRVPASALPNAYLHATELLQAQGVSTFFTQRLLKGIDLSKREKVARPILFGFLLRPDYSGHISPQALEACRALKLKYAPAFKAAQKQSHVNPNAIAALLWVETRHGKRTGSFEIGQALMHIASITDSAFVESLLTEFKKTEFKGTPQEWGEIETKAKERIATRSQWALEQLEALYRIESEKRIAVMKIKGSYAGAFGIAQFIPTSYLKYAASFDSNDVVPNLFSMNDAIMSVAHYLQEFGWDDHSREKQEQALFGYNKSKDYGQTILKISDDLTVAPDHSLSSRPELKTSSVATAPAAFEVPFRD